SVIEKEEKMAKLLILMIILLVNFILVGSENTNSTIYEPNDPEVSNPSKEEIEDIFDLMFVIIIFLIAEKIPIGIAATILNFLLQLFVSYYVILIPSLIFILMTIIEVICAAIYDIDEISELKDLEERVKELEPESKLMECKTSDYGSYMKYVVAFHDRIKNRRIV
ncbi:9312_t:CDS:2, partial [Dentiscutata heterogama]